MIAFLFPWDFVNLSIIEFEYQLNFKLIGRTEEKSEFEYESILEVKFVYSLHIDFILKVQKHK